MKLTNRQQIHRDYLQSPLWFAKRTEALNFYGPACRRCGKHGTDVHHKTYARTGGGELMEDLEIMCRDCHEAHHRVERLTRKRRDNKGINRKALALYLTPAQKQQICTAFKLTWGVVYSEIMRGETAITGMALKMLGKKYAYESKHRKPKGTSGYRGTRY